MNFHPGLCFLLTAEGRVGGEGTEGLRCLNARRILGQGYFYVVEGRDFGVIRVS